MKKKEIRKKLSKYSNGGNAYLILDFLIEKNKSIISISQEDLAKELNKTRPSIQNCLELLEKLGLIEYGYGKIKILGEPNE